MMNARMKEIAKGIHPPSGILVNTALTYMPSIVINVQQKRNTNMGDVLQITIMTRDRSMVVISMTRLTTTPANNNLVISISRVAV